MDKILENLEEADKSIRTADHMIYVTFPLIKDKRLLLKILQEIKNAIAHCINSILQYEYVLRRINLSKDPKANFRIFIEKCSTKIGITKEENGMIIELFDFLEKHKESPFEFMRNDKLVVLSNSMRTKTMSIEKMKEFIILGKSILKKTRESIKNGLQ